jgi:hypothetical protein
MNSEKKYEQVARGWFEVDGEMYDKIQPYIRGSNDALKFGWLVQDRSNMEYGQYSFVHFGNTMSNKELKCFLNLLIKIAEEVKSTYSGLADEINGEFLITEINKKVPNLRVLICNGSYEVKEC